MTVLPTQGIDGIDLPDREPVGAQLMAGIKKPGGAIDPSTTNRWWIGARHAEGAGRKAVRPLHPSFAEFNRRDVSPEARRMIRGTLCHTSAADACQVQRQAWDLACCPSSADFVACVGDSETAQRLVKLGDQGPEYEQIPCPGSQCEFAFGDGHPCKPTARLYFRPDWKEGSSLSRGMVMWATHGARTIEILLGFWCRLAEEAAALGLMPDERPYKGDAGRLALARHGVPVIGLPFELALEKRSSQGRQVTVITITPRQTFADAYGARRRQLQEAGLSEQRLIGARSAVEHEAAVVAADEAAITDTSVIEVPRRQVIEADVVEMGDMSGTGNPGLLFDVDGEG